MRNLTVILVLFASAILSYCATQKEQLTKGTDLAQEFMLPSLETVSLDSQPTGVLNQMVVWPECPAQSTEKAGSWVYAGSVLYFGKDDMFSGADIAQTLLFGEQMAKDALPGECYLSSNIGLRMAFVAKLCDTDSYVIEVWAQKPCCFNN